MGESRLLCHSMMARLRSPGQRIGNRDMYFQVFPLTFHHIPSHFFVPFTGFYLFYICQKWHVVSFFLERGIFMNSTFCFTCWTVSFFKNKKATNLVFTDQKYIFFFFEKYFKLIFQIKFLTKSQDANSTYFCEYRKSWVWGFFISY